METVFHLKAKFVYEDVSKCTAQKQIVLYNFYSKSTLYNMSS